MKKPSEYPWERVSQIVAWVIIVLGFLLMVNFARADDTQMNMAKVQAAEARYREGIAKIQAGQAMRDLGEMMVKEAKDQLSSAQNALAISQREKAAAAKAAPPAKTKTEAKAGE